MRRSGRLGAGRPNQVALAIVVALVAATLALALVAIGAVERVPPAAPPSAAIPSALPPPPAPPAPTLLSDLTPDQARASNAAEPAASGPVSPAPPFHYRGSPSDLAAAATCLTAALIYEAGDDRAGQQAVAQVVLNRARHPSFPKSVCGVVFQGSERATGCQFTFTCDGALTRDVGHDAWARAAEVANAALTGFVDRSVGTATHYHADYVVPYWRGSLRKIATVHSQIFYAFPGFWGRPAALAARSSAPETVDPRLFRFAPDLLTSSRFPLHTEEDAAPRQTLAIAGVPPAALKGAVVRLKNDDAAQYVLQLGPADPAGWAVTGYTICGGKEDCLVLGWTSEPETPRVLPVLPAAMRTLAFMYRKSSLLAEAQTLWDCARYRRPIRSQCLPR